MRPGFRPLGLVEADVKSHIASSTKAFAAHLDPGGKLWVLKYFHPRFLDAFVADPRLPISATPGFTWGDGVYAAPLAHPYTSMMYGRVGVMGWLAKADVFHAYAADSAGVDLYQEWIRSKAFLFRVLTTTVHADFANRYLRNYFRKQFDINVVEFPPDQFNRAYTSLRTDRWLCVSDWSGLAATAPAQQPKRSNTIQECEWVAIVGEEFEQSRSKITYRDLLGPHFNLATLRTAAARYPGLGADLRKCYAANRTRKASAPSQVVFVTP